MKSLRILIIVITSFFLIFCIQSSAWAGKYDEIYKVNKSQFFNINNPNYLISENNNQPNPYLLLTSILIPGLGQILVGDIWGIKFPIIFGIIILSALALIYEIDKTKDDGFGKAFAIYFLIFPVVLILSVITYIWNLVDAAHLWSEINKAEFNNSEMINVKFPKNLLESSKLIVKNQSLVYQINF